MTTFYIVRHGESEANVKKLVQGVIVDTSLTDKGREQALELAQEFADISLDMVYCSDLKRALETGKIIAKQVNIPLETTPLLRERSFGKYEGMSIDVFLSTYTEFNTLTTEEKMDYVIDEEEESNRSGVDRLITFLDATAKKHPGKAILVISHGGIIRPFLIHEKQGDFETIGGLDNCGYIKVQANEHGFIVEETKGVKTWKEKRMANTL